MRIRHFFSLLMLALLFAGAPAYSQDTSTDLMLTLGADGELSDSDIVAISMALAAEGNSPAQIAAALNNVPGPNNTAITVTPAQVATGLASTGITQAVVTATVATAMNISQADAAAATNTGFTAASNVAGATTVAAGTTRAANVATAEATTGLTLTAGGTFTTATGNPVIIKSDADLAIAVAAYVSNLGTNQLTTEQKTALTSLVNSTPSLQNQTSLVNAINSGNTNAITNQAVKIVVDNGGSVPPGVS